MVAKKTKVEMAQNPSIATNEKNRLNTGKNIEEIIKERGIQPIRDDSDFVRIFGDYKEWFNVDEFLKEAHRPWK